GWKEIVRRFFRDRFICWLGQSGSLEKFACFSWERTASRLQKVTREAPPQSSAAGCSNAKSETLRFDGGLHERYGQQFCRRDVRDGLGVGSQSKRGTEEAPQHAHRTSRSSRRNRCGRTRAPVCRAQFFAAPQLPRLPLPIEALRAKEYVGDRKSTRLNSSHQIISYAVFC